VSDMMSEQLQRGVNPAPTSFVRIGSIAGVALLLTSNLVLLRANHNLAAERETLKRQVTLNSGMRMPALEAKTLSGQLATVAFGQDGKQTVLFIFSPACPICEENWPMWERITQNADSQGLRLVALDLSGAVQPDYIAYHRMSRFILLRDPQPQSLLAYRFRQTPQTVLLASDGTVKGSWIGPLSRANADEILQSKVN